MLVTTDGEKFSVVGLAKELAYIYGQAGRDYWTEKFELMLGDLDQMTPDEEEAVNSSPFSISWYMSVGYRYPRLFGITGSARIEESVSTF